MNYATLQDAASIISTVKRIEDLKRRARERGSFELSNSEAHEVCAVVRAALFTHQSMDQSKSPGVLTPELGSLIELLIWMLPLVPRNVI